MNFFIYCSQCGFYPSEDELRVGIPDEVYAENLSKLHRTANDNHQTFLVPEHWFDETEKTHIKKIFR